MLSTFTFNAPQCLFASCYAQAWADRLATLAPQLQGPIHFLWGTDHEDAPIVNARKLSQALSPSLVYDYAAAVKQSARKGSISAFLQQGRQGQPTAAAGAEGAAGASATAQPAAAMPAAPAVPQHFAGEKHTDVPGQQGGITERAAAAPASAATQSPPPHTLAASRAGPSNERSRQASIAQTAPASGTTAPLEHGRQPQATAGTEQQESQQAPATKIRQERCDANEPSKRARTASAPKRSAQEKPLSFYFAAKHPPGS